MMLAFVLMAGLALPGPEAGDATQSPLTERVARIETCLSTSGTADPAVCIGTISKPCMDTPAGQGTVGMTACTGAETEAWESLMARWLDQAAKNPEMSETGRTRLMAGQAAWETARRESIHAYDDRLGTVYQIIAGDWWRDWTARRALWLYDLAIGPQG